MEFKHLIKEQNCTFDEIEKLSTYLVAMRLNASIGDILDIGFKGIYQKVFDTAQVELPRAKEN